MAWKDLNKQKEWKEKNKLKMRLYHRKYGRMRKWLKKLEKGMEYLTSEGIEKGVNLSKGKGTIAKYDWDRT